MIRVINKIKETIVRFIKILMSMLFIVFGLDKATGFKVKKTEHKLERLGTEYGGWVVPIDLLNENSICYSVGAGEDISFDCLLAERFGCNVYIFDPTPRAITHFEELKKSVLSGQRMNINRSKDLFYKIQKADLEKLKYYSYGIWKNDSIEKFYAPKRKEWVSHAIINSQKTIEYFEAQCKKVSTVMKELDHQKIDLLKFDVEGAEHEIINSVLEDKVPIKILCVEFDEINFNNLRSFFNIRQSIKKLAGNGFELINVDDSNYMFIRK